MKKSLKYGAMGLLLGVVGGAVLLGPFFLYGAILGAAIGAAIGHRADMHADVLKRIQAIRSALRATLADESRTAESRRVVEQWLQERFKAAVRISKGSVELVFAVVTAYIQRTPDLMEALFQSAKSSNLEREIVYLLRKTSLPQFEGGTGSIDPARGIADFLEDAFAAQYLIEKVASWQGGTLARAIEGNIDLHAGNAFIAALLPPGVVKTVSGKVDAALGASQARQMLARMLQQSAALQGSWSSGGHGVDFKKQIVKDEIYSDLAKDGIYMRPGG